MVNELFDALAASLLVTSPLSKLPLATLDILYQSTNELYALFRLAIPCSVGFILF
jgi:hypothetical protein